MSKERIEAVTDEVCEMLLEKNDAYGNSALEPINVFSKGNATQSLCARIDDKLARIQNVGLTSETEDTLFDLAGYLILLIVALKDEEEKSEDEINHSDSYYFHKNQSSTIRQNNYEKPFGK
tara:strand:+ start:1520 stop:1882 length:363 start_codon:yes stop_codon:yes gene_type:complete